MSVPIPDAGIGVIALLALAALIAFIGGALTMFWTALTFEHFGLLAPLGYWESMLYFFVTSTVINALTVKASGA